MPEIYYHENEVFLTEKKLKRVLSFQSEELR